ncbi:MAG: aldo/keto reductase [Gammaproteobacteria bacterium]|nr:aldo/keto reductase [Gammaproteobacteria bacterium]
MTLSTRAWQRTGNTLTFTELGFGTAPLGNLYRAISDDEAQAILDLAWSGGVRYYDTAPLYGLGLSETRLNRFLRGKNRDDYVLSTKVGRLLRACGADDRTGIGKWFDVPTRQEVYDYSYDGIMRSLEFSLERLGVDRVDILYVHDIDIANHGTKTQRDTHVNVLMDGGYNALIELRDQGVVEAIGAGVNEWEVCQILAERGDFDLFLLAGRYTLLEQEALESFLPLCEARGIGIVIGGPYNSGILASGPRPGAFYNYDPAPEPILEKVRQLEAVCQSHDVSLVEAAFQFPLMHPSVVAVIPGGQSMAQMQSNLGVAEVNVPAALWADLKKQGLMREDAPTA